MLKLMHCSSRESQWVPIVKTVSVSWLSDSSEIKLIWPAPLWACWAFLEISWQWSDTQWYWSLKYCSQFMLSILEHIQLNGEVYKIWIHHDKYTQVLLSVKSTVFILYIGYVYDVCCWWITQHISPNTDLIWMNEIFLQYSYSSLIWNVYAQMPGTYIAHDIAHWFVCSRLYCFYTFCFE